MPFLSLFASPLALRILGVVGLAGAIGAGFWVVRSAGYGACERDHQAALAEVLQQRQEALEFAYRRGDALAADLAATERELSATKQEYLTYANAITGNCPSGLGVLVGAASGAGTLPEAPGHPADPTATVAAAAIAANVAENYGRANACIAQLQALIAWHADPAMALNAPRNERE